MINNYHFLNKKLNYSKFICFVIVGIFTLITNSLNSQPIISGVPDTVDYGCIIKGSDPYRNFTFYNIGNEPLIIKTVKGSSGAVIPTYPREPINPSDSSEIEIRYDTNRIGEFCKTIEITTNIQNGADSLIIIKIIGEVKETVSTDEEKDQLIKIFPTVTSDYLFLESDNLVNSKNSYHIYNLSGNKLLTGKWDSIDKIFVGGLSKGQYVIVLSNDGVIVKSFRFAKLD